jgi:hypothetical protein
MLYGANVAIYSEINTTHINAVWQNVKFFNVTPFGASLNQMALKVYVKRMKLVKRVAGMCNAKHGQKVSLINLL